MSARVIFTDDFQRDLVNQTTWLIDQDRHDWATCLFSEVEELAKLLANFPLSGQVEDWRGLKQLRRMVLPRLPFVVWYVWEQPLNQVIAVRLFHARQQRLSGRNLRKKRHK